MRVLIALIACVVLLFGCIGSVPQEKYDALSASCDKAKADTASSLAAEAGRASAANARLSACTEEKQSLSALLAEREQENAALRADEAVLEKAIVKTDRIAQYNLTLQYYLDAFGPGALPNTARIRKIDAQLAVMNDMTLSSLIGSVKDCQSITGCNNAKATVQPYIEKQEQALASEAAAIIGANGG
ncbi:MAG: hypothetical protein NTX79_00770 [Candidatus Micrarchaeota archaeon]|nr:hypothetical protein [Candidatus Micrarchaeota archaeon]